MCDSRSSARIPVMAYSGEIRVDKCMRHIIDFLWHKGINTLACCCGHGRKNPVTGEKYPMTIVIRNRMGRRIEIMSGKEIPRERRFYRKDEQGYYYIPEVTNDKEQLNAYV